MHVISRKKLVAFWTVHADAKDQLAAWFKTAEKATWKQWAAVKRVFPKASYFESCLIFDICGGNYRLVARRSENWTTLFVVGILTHADYDRDGWKKSCSDRPAQTAENKHGRKNKRAGR